MAAPDLRIECIEERHIDPYARLSRVEYGAEAAVSQPAHLRWKYLENPAGPATGIHLYDHGELIARMAAMPRQFRCGEKTYTAAYMADLLVHPQRRGMGILLKLAEGVRQLRSYDLVLVTPNPSGESFWKAMLRLPDQFDLDVSAIPLRPAKLLRAAGKLPVGELTSLVDTPWRAGLAALGMTARIPGGIRAERAWPDRDALNRLWQTQWQELAVGVRDANYLDWRFRRSPVFKYDVLFFYRKRCLCGYVATRCKEYGGSTGMFIVDAGGMQGLPNGQRIKASLGMLPQAAAGDSTIFLAIGNTAVGPLKAAASVHANVPQRLVPRKTTLFAKWLSSPAFAIRRESMAFTLGDCDMV